MISFALCSMTCQSIISSRTELQGLNNWGLSAPFCPAVDDRPGLVVAGGVKGELGQGSPVAAWMTRSRRPCMSVT
jgi:hypothetical protein